MDPSRIWVEVVNKRIPMGMDPGHPQVHLCSALLGEGVDVGGGGEHREGRYRDEDGCHDPMTCCTILPFLSHMTHIVTRCGLLSDDSSSLYGDSSLLTLLHDSSSLYNDSSLVSVLSVMAAFIPYINPHKTQ